MYVRDLEVHCLLKPSKGYAWHISPISEYTNFGGPDQDKAVAELRHAGIGLHGTVRYEQGRHANFADAPAIYIGVTQLDNYYFGVKKQHTFIAGDTVFVMDGYQIKDCEKI